ncbi:MAG: SUMF1/EgtB/PvdO family nonheme iron enzyme [Candidatus Accumulibacter meliphilus]|uniref:SUMF1/EgtB/PvdO family nonheme iron enzyme n=1 Tax=Candidatus Accumulibacter meliphilus TaxID=2211374 RepID=UPI002FC28174
MLLPLEAAYVPLSAKSMEQSEDTALNQVLDLGRRLAIIGGPGCGKTTVLLHMAWALASSLLTGKAEPAHSRLGMAVKPSDLPLPVLVPLASFARYRRSLSPNAPAREKTLAHFISYHLISKQADFDLPADFFVQLLYDGRDVLLLLDGLDEVANEDERAEVRQSVEDLVRGREAARVVVTCRTLAYRSGRTALGAHFHEIVVQPLDFECHISPMVQQAYACIYPHDAALRAERVRDLLTGIGQLESDRRARLSGGGRALVDSPLMVRLLLIVHVNNRRLPDERAELFDKAINALLQVDYGHDESDIRELSTDWKLFRDMAQHVAFHMHQQGTDQGREIDESALKLVLRQEPEYPPRIDDFLKHARQRGSVLEEREGVYRFIHLAFQEFLVARYLREVVGSGGREAILDFLNHRLDDPWWREPVLLLVGYWATNAAKAARDLIGALARTRAGGESDVQFSAAELAATAALEWRECGETTGAECARRIVDLLTDVTALRSAQPFVRARAGDRLAQLGDPRFDPQRFSLPVGEMLGFVGIAADAEFRIGTRTADARRLVRIIGEEGGDDEINDAFTPTSVFHIARYPVTVAQFRAFIEATDYELGNRDALRDPDSRPVRWISWYEAIAYCDWLNKILADSPLLERSAVAQMVRQHRVRVTLPSELEWEKASRGALSRAVFPWGDEADSARANCSGSGIGDTSAVGCFSANEFGLHDMIGNVWEWTRSRYRPYPYDAHDGREELQGGDDIWRVVRGGSWVDGRYHARCAWRDGIRPHRRYLNDGGIGFRVVLRSGAAA